MIEHEQPVLLAASSRNQRRVTLLDIWLHVVGQAVRRADVMDRRQHVRNEDDARLPAASTKANRLLSPGVAGDEEDEDAGQHFRLALAQLVAGVRLSSGTCLRETARANRSGADDRGSAPDYRGRYVRVMTDRLASASSHSRRCTMIAALGKVQLHRRRRRPIAARDESNPAFRPGAARAGQPAGMIEMQMA